MEQEQVKAKTREFAAKLAEAFERELVSVTLYGGLARGEYHPESSDVNLMLVFREVTLEILEKLAPLLDRMQLEIQLNPLCLAENELNQSARVFPIKFLDIQRQHETLYGRSIALHPQITPEQLRRQCLQDLVNLQLRLRLFYLQRHRPEQVLETILQTLPGFLVVLGTLLGLESGKTYLSKTETLEAADKLLIERAALHRLIQLKESHQAPPVTELRALYGKYMNAVECAAAFAAKADDGVAH